MAHSVKLDNLPIGARIIGKVVEESKMNMKKISPVILCLGGALTGAFLVLALFWAKPELASGLSGEKKAQFQVMKRPPSILDEDAFPSFDSFFGQFPQFAGQMIGNGFEGQEIEFREDDSFGYYELKFAGQDGSKIDASVEEGQVNISGTIRNTTQRGVANVVSESNFHRSFPLPPHFDGTKMEILSEQGKVILKFPRRK